MTQTLSMTPKKRPDAKLLTPKEAAYYLGVSEATLRGWRKAGKGPTVVRLTLRTYRYSEASIKEYIESGSLGDKS